ncbi:MAG: hypothetical protein UE295_12495 [Acutalibacteraceae bacterium]|nr:hypothetical protein [Acutalibacteraceae bacterium]
MAMGTTGTVNISVKMFDDIKTAVADYRTKTNTLKDQLESEVNGLVGVSFVGEAANGFKDFYTKNIVPANGEGLANLLKAIDDIAQSASDAIPGGNGLDDQLAEGNRQ